MDKGRKGKKKKIVVLSSFPVKNFTISFMHFLSFVVVVSLAFRDTKNVFLNYVSLVNGNDGREILFSALSRLHFVVCHLRMFIDEDKEEIMGLQVGLHLEH